MSIDRSSLEVKPREGAGKGAARKLRLEGLIPAVVYGRHLKTPAHIAVDPLAIRKAIATPHKFNTLISLKISGGGEHQVLLKDYQQDPVTREILHADFVDVKETEKIKVNVPLVLVGKAVGVAEGGILSQSRRTLEVWALPRAIPEKIEADISHLKIAAALHIKDIKMPEGVEVKSNINYTLAVVSVPEKEEVVAVAAPVPGSAAVGADGKPVAAAAAPAEGGKAAPGAAPGAAAGAAPGKGAPAKKDDKKK
jgi:large subunit ribosomal protein L25